LNEVVLDWLEEALKTWRNPYDDSSVIARQDGVVGVASTSVLRLRVEHLDCRSKPYNGQLQTVRELKEVVGSAIRDFGSGSKS
jgi:hypothetical protein